LFLIKFYSCKILLIAFITLWAWGKNETGLFGNGTKTDSLSPIQIGTDTDWAFVSSNSVNCLAVKTNRELWGWGSSLGNTTPVQIGTNSNWASAVTIWDANLQGVILDIDGTLWVWEWVPFDGMKMRLYH